MKSPLFLVCLLSVPGSFAQEASAPSDESLQVSDGELVEMILPDRPVVHPDTGRWVDAAPLHPYTLTVSTVHLLGFLSLEGSLERAITLHYGVTLFGGVGTLPTLFGVLRGPGLDVQEIGAQVRWYPNAPARWNPHLGLEGFWGRADYRQDLSEKEGDWFVLDFSGVWTAFGGGPFIGTKFVSQNRYVAEFQLGAEMWRVTDENGNVGLLPWLIVNVNIGKSF